LRLRVAAAAMIGLALLTALALFISIGPDPSAVPTAEAVAGRVMSPYCTGLLVADCPTRQSAELRSHIEEKVELGWTNRQIDQWLVVNYGEQVLGRPRTMVSWIVPIGAVMIGLVALGSVLVRRKPFPVSEAGAQIAQEERDRVTADLGRYTRDTTE